MFSVTNLNVSLIYYDNEHVILKVFQYWSVTDQAGYTDTIRTPCFDLVSQQIVKMKTIKVVLLARNAPTFFLGGGEG